MYILACHVTAPPTQVTNQLSLCGLVEFVFHLSRVDPDILHITSNTGQLTQSFFTFQINQKGALIFTKMDSCVRIGVY